MLLGRLVVAQLGQPGRAAVASAGRVDDEIGVQLLLLPALLKQAYAGDAICGSEQAERLVLVEDLDVVQLLYAAANVVLQRGPADTQTQQAGFGVAQLMAVVDPQDVAVDAGGGEAGDAGAEHDRRPSVWTLSTDRD